MASASSQSLLVLRDSDASSSSTLPTGAIVGIACGAGALFLGAAGLFIMYWRRQRQYDREDYGDSFDERGPQGVMGPAVTYTMDYKMDESEHREGDHGSAYTYSPEKPTYPFSPMSGSETASAMPTHPAYIPRALVRGAATPSNRSNRSTATTSPPPFPTPPFPSAVSSGHKNQPDDTMIQAYLYAATAGPTQPQPQDLSDSGASASFSGGLPTHPSPPNTLSRHPHPNSQPSPTLPSHISPPNSASSTTDQGHYSHYSHHSTTSSTQALRSSSSSSKPRAYLPPRLNLSPKPLQGRENTTISGPLAFPQHYHHPGHPGPPGQPGQSSVSASGWAREEFPDGACPAEEQPSSGGRKGFFGSSGEGRSKEKDKDKKKKKEKKHGRQRSGGNRHYAEIEIGRGSDIW